MKNTSNLRKLGIAAASILVGLATKEILRYGWTKLNGTPPPENPNNDDTKTSDAVLWTVGVAAFSGLAKLMVDTTLERQGIIRNT